MSTPVLRQNHDDATSARPDAPEEKAKTFEIRAARKEDDATLATLMATEIDWGRMRYLGHGFLTLLHRHMATSKHALCLVAASPNNEILGYFVTTTDYSKFYRAFALRYGFRVALVLLPKLLNPKHLKVILRGMTYSPEPEPDVDAQADTISVAVRSDAQRRGIAKALFLATVDALKPRGIKRLKIATTDDPERSANHFYQGLGCRLVNTRPFYEDTQINVYVYDVQ